MTEEINQFIDLVAEMRETQKEYFKTRKKGPLMRAKTLENKVDIILKRLKNL